MKMIKKILIPVIAVFAFFLISGCNSTEKEYNQVNEEGKKTGLWKYYYDDGNLHRKVFYEDDIKTGTETLFYHNGEIQAKMEWAGDEFGSSLHGDIVQYYENGNLMMIGYYNEGLPEGKFLYFYENGNRKQEEFYEDGLKAGEWYYYRPNGHLKYIIDFNGHELRWSDDYKSGVYTHYSDEGVKFFRATYIGGQLMEEEILNEGFYLTYIDELD